jgi:glucose-1-phosphate adenylyltransferase
MSASCRKRLSTFILAGGKGERLYPLTKYRAKPAVPFGGVYRIIDFTLSNCINSGIRRINVLSQYKSKSLAHHLKTGWSIFHTELNEYIDLIPAQKRVGETWYRGTADALYQNIYTLEQENPDHVLVLAGDHVYKMDYARMLDSHLQSQADATIGVVERPKEESVHFGVLQVGKGNRVRAFEEKPTRPATVPGREDRIYASMGIYVFTAKVLLEELVRDAKRESEHDFGKNILPSMLGRRELFACSFVDPRNGGYAYWRDIGTLEAYYHANMDLLSARPRFDLYDVEWPVRTYQPQAPPAKMVAADDGGSNGSGEVLDSVVSNGCLIRGGRVIRSVLSAGVRVQSHAVVENSVLMEGVEVGEYAAIRNAIIDKNARIPAGASIGYDMEEDRKCYAVTPSGLVVIEKGWSIESAEHRPSSREPSLNDPMPPWEAPVFSAPRAQACM